MVWIHGGSLYNGEGAQYSPVVLAGNEDVVVVTLNYRLGLLGSELVPSYLKVLESDLNRPCILEYTEQVGRRGVSVRQKAK